jgi:hypothetical protein
MFSCRSLKCQPTSYEACPLFAARCHSKANLLRQPKKDQDYLSLEIAAGLGSGVF